MSAYKYLNKTSTVTLIHKFDNKFKVNNNMIHLTILITTECNLSCRYCFSVAGLCQRRGSLTVANANMIVSNINVPVSSISLSGGEPFLHTELKQLYTLFSQRHPTWITTNGTMLCYRNIKTLVSEKGLYVTVSLNAIKQHIDFSLRGIYCNVDNILSSIQTLSKISDKLKVNTIISSINIYDVYKIGDFLSKINVMNNLIWRLLQITINSNVVSDCSDLLIPNYEFRKIANSLHRIFGTNININSSTSAELERSCYMVSPFGDVFNMEKSKEAIGNILETKLSCIL